MPKKVIINGFSYDWGALRPRFRKVREELPLQMAAVAQNFFVDSFQRQGWYDGLTLTRWQPRAGESWRRKKKGRRGNRGILIKTGRLRRSIKIRSARFQRIVIATDARYAAIHNFGFDGYITVRSHTRHRFMRQSEEYTTKTGKQHTRQKKVVKSSFTVRQHTRKMSMPQRQFMGHSPMLDRKLNKVIERQMEYLFDHS